MTSFNVTSFPEIGDSGWFKDQIKNLDLDVDVTDSDTADCFVYDPNLKGTGSYPIDYVKTGAIVESLTPGKKYILSTAQEPISVEGRFEYHENVNVTQNLYRKCLELNFNPDDILYISGDRFVQKYNNTPVKSMFAPAWNHLFWYEDTTDSMDITQRQCYATFLSFNRIHKPHRMYFLARLEQENLIENNLISCAEIIDGATFQEHFNWIINDYNKYGQYYDPHGLLDLKSLLYSVEKIQQNLPMVLDVSDFQNNGCFRSDSFWSSLPFYQNSFMSIITESNAIGPGCYISEAILRPFVFMHPFMTIAQPRTLETLRLWGFDVFDDVFDNSYDIEPDMFTRTEMVISQAKKFQEMGPGKLKELTLKLRPRLEKNRSWYFSRDFRMITRKYFERIVNWPR